jgi:hypothetical protein
VHILLYFYFKYIIILKKKKKIKTICDTDDNNLKLKRSTNKQEKVIYKKKYKIYCQKIKGLKVLKSTYYKFAPIIFIKVKNLFSTNINVLANNHRLFTFEYIRNILVIAIELILVRFSKLLNFKYNTYAFIIQIFVYVLFLKELKEKIKIINNNF